MKRNLVLTFDYELYGDGSGDVMKHIINPTNKILKICDRFEIKATLFFEVIEYIKLKKEWDIGNNMGYDSNPVTAIEEQLKNAALKGHDIQLHIHPQWVNAVYEQDKWKVDLLNWRLGDFKDTSYSLKDILLEGKETIENIIKPVKSDYRCEILRAGGFNVMPSIEIFKAMKEIGLKVDSSVYPGGFENGSLSKYDYRNVSLDMDYWWADEIDITMTLKSNLKGGILEFPVFALQCSNWKKISLLRIKSVLLNRKSAMKNVKSKTLKKSYIQRLRYFFKKEAFTWDFCLFHKGLHNYFFRYIDNNLNNRKYFILIGHPKNFTDESSLISFILKSKEKNFSFKPLNQVYEEING